MTSSSEWHVWVLFWFGCDRQQKRNVATPAPAGGAEENGKKEAETGGSG